MTVQYQPPDAILFLTGSPIAVVIATVASTMLGSNLVSLNPLLERLPSVPRQSVILLTENQISTLPGLRLKGFRGAVLVISPCSLTTLKKQYRILCWGEESHEAFAPNANLHTLLIKVIELVPLEPENLDLLQKELKLAPEKLLKQQVFPLLKRLQSQSSYVEKDLDSLAELVERFRSQTPATCHTIVEIAGHRAQIQQHFRTYIERLRAYQRDNQEASANLEWLTANLRQVFERWRDGVRSSGEML